ncbi:Wadjet anti-phage system protein JetD domain-containing protein [Thiohalorhabdus methylotrophus]|uniref:Wadjet anti-phage system protein JetD domain-containing protein n=1 Tax=Thiohalorhabdus methylotrophus TaxID=3242694 RepID=A0ABV4TWR5_9GAMM
MNTEVAVSLLTKLLRKADRQTDPSRTTTLSLRSQEGQEYVQHGDVDARDAIHGQLKNAQAEGAVELVWGRGSAENKLVSIRLVDGDRLADYLGQPRGGELGHAIREATEPELAEAPDWVREVFEAQFPRWARHENALGLAPDDPGRIAQVFRVVALLAQGAHQGLDQRSFGALLLGDSKFLERSGVRGAVGRIWKAAHETDLSTEELFEELGLKKFPPSLYLRGALEVEYSGVPWDLGRLVPYVGMDPSHVSRVLASGAVSYVLTIENLATFHRYVREVDDSGVVLYTAGFPGPEFRAVYGMLDKTLEPPTPFYHWGDRDVGGLRILRRLEQVLRGHSLQPHLMESGGTEGEPFLCQEWKALQGLAGAEEPATASLAYEWLRDGVSKREQEVQAPASPLHMAG